MKFEIKKPTAIHIPENYVSIVDKYEYVIHCQVNYGNDSETNYYVYLYDEYDKALDAYSDQAKSYARYFSVMDYGYAKITLISKGVIYKQISIQNNF